VRGVLFWGLDVGCGCCLDAARHPKDGRIRGARLTAFMGDAEAQSARDTQSEAKKTELEKDVGKVGSFVRIACFV